MSKIIIIFVLAISVGLISNSTGTLFPSFANFNNSDLKNNEMKEVFKSVKDYEGLYWISNLGRVKSKQGLKSFCDNGNGYNYVDLYKDNKRKKFRINRMVAIHFLPNPNNFKVVNHIDFNRKNNIVSNLEWTTQRDNCNLKHKKSTSVYVGVSRNNRLNKPWTASIYKNGKPAFLGRFEKEYDAHIAYQNEFKQL